MNDTPRIDDAATRAVVRRFRRGHEVLACRRHARAVDEFLNRLESGADCDAASCPELVEHFGCYECQLMRSVVLDETRTSDEEQELAITAFLNSFNSTIATSPPTADRVREADGAAPARSFGLGALVAGARGGYHRRAPIGGWWAGIAAAGVVGLVVGGVWLANVGRHSSPGSGPEDRLPTTLSVTLSPGLTRGGGEQQPLVIPAGVSSVRLQLSLEESDYPRYHVSLETPEGSQIWHLMGAPSLPTGAGNPAVTVSLPATLLPPGDYVIRLTGVSLGKARPVVVEAYALRVVEP